MPDPGVPSGHLDCVRSFFTKIVPSTRSTVQRFFDAVAKAGMPPDASRPARKEDERRDRTLGRPPGGVVLVVDDEPYLRRALCEYLMRNCFAAIGVATAAAAYSQVLELRGQICALITDMVIPGGGGWDLAQRTRRVVPDLAVIFISGAIDEHVVTSASSHPRTGFLQKPFELSALTDALNSLLEKRTSKIGPQKTERQIGPNKKAG
jgi:CheY-like chemotaxis protein